MEVKGQFYALAGLPHYQLVRRVHGLWAWAQWRRKNMCPWRELDTNFTVKQPVAQPL